MTLTGLEFSARGMSPDDLSKALMDLLPSEMVALIARFGEGDRLTEAETKRLEQWKKTKTGKRVLRLWKKHGD